MIATGCSLYDAEPFFVKAVAQSIKNPMIDIRQMQKLTFYKRKAARPATAAMAAPPALMLDAAPVKADGVALVTLVPFVPG